MTETKEKFDFSAITGHATVRLRKPKVAPVDPHIVRQAQRSWNGVEENGSKLHVLEHEFANPEMAAEFARQMRKAGAHTVPETTVSAVIDPEESGNTRLVRWKAGRKRGAKPSGHNGSTDG